MTTTIPIDRFVSHDVTRPALTQPIHYQGNIYATDGRIAVELTGVGEQITHSKMGEQIQNIISEAHAERYRNPTAPPTDFPRVVWEPCPDCVAKGKPSAGCDWCDGDGKTRFGRARGVQSGNHRIDEYYIEMLELLPKVMWDVSFPYTSDWKAQAIPFTFEGGRGVVMGMRQ